MRMYHGLLLSLSICVTTATATSGFSSRESVSFDFGWWHRAGLTAWAGRDTQPPPFDKIYNYIGPSTHYHPPESHLNYSESQEGWKQIHLPHDALIAAGPR